MYAMYFSSMPLKYKYIFISFYQLSMHECIYILIDEIESTTIRAIVY